MPHIKLFFFQRLIGKAVNAEGLLNFALLADYFFVAALVMTDRHRFILLLLRELVLTVSLFINLIFFGQLVDSDNLAHLVLSVLVDDPRKAASNDLLEMVIRVIKPLHHLVSGDSDSLAVVNCREKKLLSSFTLC
jgi:hypothetical protein